MVECTNCLCGHWPRCFIVLLSYKGAYTLLNNHIWQVLAVDDTQLYATQSGSKRNTHQIV